MKTRVIACGAAFLAVLMVFSIALRQLDSGRKAEGARILEESVRRSAAACYAAEGMYPPDLDYLQEHYGLQIDGSRYTVCYSVFGANMMPDITVLETVS